MKEFDTKISEIESQLGAGLNPHVASDLRVLLSGYYSRMSGELQEIRAVKPMRWMMMRKELATDKATDMAWSGSEMGISEMRLTMNMTRIKQVISSLSSYLRNAENEARYTNI